VYFAQNYLEKNGYDQKKNLAGGGEKRNII
jgi:hypothetical protein